VVVIRLATAWLDRPEPVLDEEDEGLAPGLEDDEPDSRELRV
jgi:hypothetical protein